MNEGFRDPSNGEWIPMELADRQAVIRDEEPVWVRDHARFASWVKEEPPTTLEQLENLLAFVRWQEQRP